MQARREVGSLSRVQKESGGYQMATVCSEHVHKRLSFAECVFWLFEIASMQEEPSFKTKCRLWTSSKRGIVNISKLILTVLKFLKASKQGVVNK